MLIPADITYPKMALVAQHFPASHLDDVPGAIRAEMARLGVAGKVRPGMRIAVTAGSRGITGIPVILATVVSELKRLGATPFLVPCMGSHGGATPEGQIAVLHSLGVTEGSAGCPIYSSMDTVQIGQTAEGIPVFMDKIAAGADGIVVVNRIKAHTDFMGAIGSGWLKMLTIGLGKHRGALTAHRNILQLTHPVVILAVAREVIRTAPLLFGLGTIENAYDQTAEVVAAWPQDFEETEKAMLVRARALMARLPFRQMDILIVDELGKEISGAGMDPNVTGRGIARDGSESLLPDITRIVVRDLSETTHGNAVGVGTADFVTQRLVDRLDRRSTYINCLTSGGPGGASIPMTAQTDREAVEWAFLTIGAVESARARVVHIQNTMHLERFYASEALRPEIDADPQLEILGTWAPIAFDAAGSLLPERVLP
jgi:hypothetical protein